MDLILQADFLGKVSEESSLICKSEITNGLIKIGIEFRVKIVAPENVFVNLNLGEFDALLDSYEAELLRLLSESYELLLVIIFIHESRDRVNHFRNCAESIAEAVGDSRR